MSSRNKLPHSPIHHLHLLIIALIALIVAVGGGQALEIEECRRAMGMESGRIGDGQLSASSAFDPSTGPSLARLNTESGSGAWCPSTQINATSHEWIQVEMATESWISGIRTQGRWDKGRGLEFPAAYMIEYWRHSLGRWARYKDAQGDEIIRGNSDTQSAVLRLLDGAILAKLVRIIPVSESVRTVCLRFELYGCPYKEPLLSYSAPVGAFVDALDFRDSSFDGTIGGHDNRFGVSPSSLVWQHNGLGRLFDGFIGEDNFEERPKGWIGWHRSQQIVPFLPLEFRFARRQNLSAILLHISNFRKRGALLFHSAILRFAPFDDGRGEFSARALHWHQPEDTKFEGARWLRIPIPHRIATRLRVDFHFGVGADWLLLSEVRFESENAGGTIIEEDDLRPHSSNFSTLISYSAENGAEKDEEEENGQEGELASSANCFLQIAILSTAILLTSSLFCLCLFAIARCRRRPSGQMKMPPSFKIFSNNSSSQSSSSGCSSYSSPPPPCYISSNSKTSSPFLLSQFLQNARRKMDYSKVQFNSNSQSNSLLKSSTENGDQKELMQIARLMMRQNGPNDGHFGGGDGGEESDEYADPDAAQCCGGTAATVVNKSSPHSFGGIGRPAQIQLHFSGGTNRRRPNGLVFSQGAGRRRIESPNATSSASSYHRYRATPTLAQFPPIILPPPLPPALPPPRRIE